MSEEDDKSGRLTFKGDEKPLITKLCELQKKLGTMSLISYEDESEVPSKSKLIRGEKGIDGNIEFLGIVHASQPNMSYGKNAVKKILENVAAENKLKFKNNTEKDDWIKTMSCRWRNVCRQASQGESRKPKPNWVNKILPWNFDEEADNQHELEEPDAKEQEPEQSEEDVAEKQKANTELEPTTTTDWTTRSRTTRSSSAPS